MRMTRRRKMMRNTMIPIIEAKAPLRQLTLSVKHNPFN